MLLASRFVTFLWAVVLWIGVKRHFDKNKNIPIRIYVIISKSCECFQITFCSSWDTYYLREIQDFRKVFTGSLNVLDKFSSHFNTSGPKHVFFSASDISKDQMTYLAEEHSTEISNQLGQGGICISYISRTFYMSWRDFFNFRTSAVWPRRTFGLTTLVGLFWCSMPLYTTNPNLKLGVLL